MRAWLVDISLCRKVERATYPCRIERYIYGLFLAHNPPLGYCTPGVWRQRSRRHSGASVSGVPERDCSDRKAATIVLANAANDKDVVFYFPTGSERSLQQRVRVTVIGHSFAHPIKRVIIKIEQNINLFVMVASLATCAPFPDSVSLDTTTPFDKGA